MKRGGFKRRMQEAGEEVRGSLCFLSLSLMVYAGARQRAQRQSLKGEGRQRGSKLQTEHGGKRRDAKKERGDEDGDQMQRETEEEAMRWSVETISK
ncbi:hypothetical protein EYF80_021477 [Liparis tanakae]|uniref:Uncharacterized protein n=1 Tax=Liparis tanakae TaxID=230148 RepID=A0A4Z2HTH6_9TELE|nr:hypothetical protein EYF80_021477 [Liparis tanakae]